METSFYRQNRKEFADYMEPGEAALFYCGETIRRSCDENYDFFANRNFIYLCGINQKESILLLEKEGESCLETLYILEPDFMKERWEGSRITAERAEAISGISNIKFIKEFPNDVKRVFEKIGVNAVYLDIDRVSGQLLKSCADRMQEYLNQTYPHVKVNNALPVMKKLRTIKKPCEIKAMEIAQKITKAGIEAMMKSSRPGMYEYQYKAEYDYALAQHNGVAAPFSIISAGKNNFCIHYDSFTGQAADGDMILNDVGARWDYEVTDVSRGWPCNGKFSDKQRLLYECAYRTSEYMFETLKPGIPMEEVDNTIRRYNYEQLKEAGICKSYDEVGTYMWHKGAHHVGLDVHDAVDAADAVTAPGMVFCIDVGIYHEEWGIGFRLEDNCLITEDGCSNLSKDTPRTVEEIESIMKKGTLH